MDISRKIAREVFAAFRGDDSEDRRRVIRDIGTSVATGSAQDAECLVAFTGPESPSLFRFTYTSRIGITQCDQIFDCVPAGDTGNGAFFWAMRYYRKSLPIGQLVKLGAHVVVAAGKLNSGVIAGLEVVTGDSGGFHRWSIQDNDSLESEITIEAERIGDIVLAPRV
jgi:hypothetical protein